MTRTHFPAIRPLLSIACISMILLTAACDSPDEYYDANGNYMPMDTLHDGNMRAGRYDRSDYYIAQDAGMNIPEEMLPPHGMCRVWFTNRMASAQPAIESCVGIRGRVPAGAYVIYGG